MWNCHKIRAKRGAGLVGGRPYLMYSLPEVFGTVDCSFHISEVDLSVCLDESIIEDQLPCDEDVFQLATIYMLENGFNKSTDCYELVDLYTNLRACFLNDI